jgi:hypothetical protein
MPNYPRIFLKKQDGTEIHIDCQNLPTLGGPPVHLIILNVELRHDDNGNYDYLYIPPGNGGQIAPGDIEIKVQAPIVVDSLVLPNNGGQINIQPDSADHVTIKAKKH